MQKNHNYRYFLTLVCFVFFVSTNTGQTIGKRAQKSFFAPADSFSQKRFNVALGASTATFTGFSIALYQTWYKKYPRERFHTFDDWGEWSNMDKLGHIYTPYFQGVLAYSVAKWTGLSDNKSIWVGALSGAIFQTTVEIMDGFSSKWGFSLADYGANLTGVAAFALQQKYWGEQRIKLKMSSYPRKYPEIYLTGSKGTSVSLQERADKLFGSTFPERFLKDYNAQAYWASINVNSFLPTNNRWPDWLNVAVGYGADNMFGGFENRWVENGEIFETNDPNLDRVHQFYLGLNMDLTKFKTGSHFWDGLLSIINLLNSPTPAIEFNSRGEIKFHILR